jgi:hypothetical protein
MLQVPDQYAGQQMRCPLCNNIFTVPGLADAPAMPPAPPPQYSPPPAAPPPMPSNAPTPPSPLLPVPDPTKSQAPAPPPPPVVVGDYEKMKSCFISPRVVPWITFGAVTTMFLMSFFPYGFASITLGKTKPTDNPTILGVGKASDQSGTLAVRGNTWGLGFGDGDALFLIYDLLLVFAFLVAVGSILIQLKLIPAPPALENLRGLVLGGLLLVAFVFMFLKQLISIFDMSVLPLTFFGLLGSYAHMLALVTVLFEIWLQRRGPTRPIPRIDVHW